MRETDDQGGTRFITCQLKHLNYDNRNRVWDVRWDNNVAPITVTGYDAASRVTSIETPDTFVHYGYNDANRVIWEDQGLLGYPVHRIEKAPDADGNPTQLVVTTNGAVEFAVYYDYTQRNQLAHITQADSSPLYSYTYDAAGNMTRRHGEIIGDSTNAPSGYYFELNRPTYWEQTRGGDVGFSGSHYRSCLLTTAGNRWRREQNGAVVSGKAGTLKF